MYLNHVGGRHLIEEYNKMNMSLQIKVTNKVTNKVTIYYLRMMLMIILFD